MPALIYGHEDDLVRIQFDPESPTPFVAWDDKNHTYALPFLYREIVYEKELTKIPSNLPELIKTFLTTACAIKSRTVLLDVSLDNHGRVVVKHTEKDTWKQLHLCQHSHMLLEEIGVPS
jgi:hypothetical protein